MNQFHLFDFADYDCNGSIDESEMQRYNGPIFVQNVETSDTRVIGHYNGFMSAGSFNGKLIQDVEIDYYPGLNVEKVNEKGRKTFTLIDKDHNGVLSEEEVTNIVNIKKKVEETADAVKKLSDEKTKGMLGSFYAPFVGSTAVGVGIGVAEGSLIAGFTFGGGVGIALGAVVLGGYLLYEHLTSDRKEQAKELIDNLEQEIGNEPYVQEHKMIENLREIF